MKTVINGLEKTIVEQGYLSALFECTELLRQHQLQASYFYSAIVKKLTFELIVFFFKEKAQSLTKQASLSKSATYKSLLYLWAILDTKIIMYPNIPIIQKLYWNFLNLYQVLFLNLFPEVGSDINLQPKVLNVLPFFTVQSATFSKKFEFSEISSATIKPF